MPADVGRRLPCAQPTLKIRNYTPRDEKIEHEKLAPANPQRYEPPPPDEDEAAAEAEVRHRQGFRALRF